MIALMLDDLRANPLLLKKEVNSETLKLLQTQANKKAQGTGNKVTEQEANFADLLEKHGFSFQPKEKPLVNGNLYQYQRNGSQKEGDFSVLEVVGGVVIKERIFDLKHTLGKSFYLNDGWFHDEIIYVITWNAGTPKKPNIRAHIALGDNIPTEEEKAFMQTLQAFKTEKNSVSKKVGSLRPYVRFANQYSCQTFLEAEEREFTAVKSSL